VIEVYEKHRDKGKPILASFVGGLDTHEAMRMLNRAGIPAYPIPERAVVSLAKMLEYRRYLVKAGVAV